MHTHHYTLGTWANKTQARHQVPCILAGGAGRGHESHAECRGGGRPPPAVARRPRWAGRRGGAGGRRPVLAEGAALACRPLQRSQPAGQGRSSSPPGIPETEVCAAHKGLRRGPHWGPGLPPTRVGAELSAAEALGGSHSRCQHRTASPSSTERTTCLRSPGSGPATHWEADVLPNPGVC